MQDDTMIMQGVGDGTSAAEVAGARPQEVFTKPAREDIIQTITSLRSVPGKSI